MYGFISHLKRIKVPHRVQVPIACQFQTPLYASHLHALIPFNPFYYCYHVCGPQRPQPLKRVSGLVFMSSRSLAHPYLRLAYPQLRSTASTPFVGVQTFKFCFTLSFVSLLGVEQDIKSTGRFKRRRFALPLVPDQTIHNRHTPAYYSSQASQFSPLAFFYLPKLTFLFSLSCSSDFPRLPHCMQSHRLRLA